MNTKTAMKIRKGLPSKNPQIANSTAMVCPTTAAIRVACACLIRVASRARRTLPPSIGNAGSMLKTTRNTLIARSLASTLPPGILDAPKIEKTAEHEEQPEGDDHVDGGARERHDKLL